MQITEESGARNVDLPNVSSFRNSVIVWHEVIITGDTTTVFLIIEPE